MKTKLDIDFEKAYEISCSTHKKLPPDIMLKLYAYYKQATKGNNKMNPTSADSMELRNAFKLNAWTQLINLTEVEAKKIYIELVNKYIINNN